MSKNSSDLLHFPSPWKHRPLLKKASAKLGLDNMALSKSSIASRYLVKNSCV